MKLTAFLSALIFAVSLWTAASAAEIQENNMPGTDEPAVTITMGRISPLVIV